MQAAAWRAVLDWERSNPQHLDGPLLAPRVALAYDQALMPLRHFPEACSESQLPRSFQALIGSSALQWEAKKPMQEPANSCQ